MKHPYDITIDGYINSSYVTGEKPKLSDIEYDCGTIGRCDPVEKKPFLLKDWLETTTFKTIVITNTPVLEKELKYLSKNSHWDGVMLDMNHKDVVKQYQSVKPISLQCGMKLGVSLLYNCCLMVFLSYSIVRMVVTHQLTCVVVKITMHLYQRIYN